MNKIKLIACGAVVSVIGSMPAAAVVNPTHHDASHRGLVRNGHLNNAVPHRNMSLQTTSPQQDVRQDPLSQMLDDNTQTAINIQEWHHGDSSL